MKNNNSITVKFLEDNQLNLLHECFLESFKDYAADISYMTQEILTNRMAMGRIKIENCVGAFCNGKMVGFINVGIGMLNNDLSGWDGGTGVIKEYRGQGVTGLMFNLVREKLTGLGVKRFYLEVFQENSSAIRAYEKEGFKITRSFNCYDIYDFNLLDVEIEDIYSLSSIDKDQLESFYPLLSYTPSWENSMESAQNLDSSLITKGLFKDGRGIGFISFNSVMNWVLSVGVSDEAEVITYTKALFGSIIPYLGVKSNSIGINNIESDNIMNKILSEIGFRVVFKQYEMVLAL